MKFLLKDESVAKLRKLPKWIWYIIFAVSFFLRDTYVLIEQSKLTAQNYLEYLGGESIINFGSTALIVFSCIFAPAIYTLFAEIIMNFCYNVLGRRFVMALNSDDFTFRTRLILILSNLIIGVISVVYYFMPSSIGIISSIIDFGIPTLLFGIFYEYFRVMYLPKRNHFRVFSYVAKIYLGIFLAMSLFSFMLYMLSVDVERTTLDTVAYSLDLGIKLIFVLLGYLYAKRLKIKSQEPEDNDIFIVKDEPKQDDTVFKDFNF